MNSSKLKKTERSFGDYSNQAKGMKLNSVEILHSNELQSSKSHLNFFFSPAEILKTLEISYWNSPKTDKKYSIN